MSLLSLFAQVTSDYSYDYSYATNSVGGTSSAGIAVGILVFLLLIGLVVYVFFAICLMKLFKKAGRIDSWAAFVPIYNTYVFFEVAGRPGWWAFLGLIPIVGSVAALLTLIIGSIDFAKSFGKDLGYGILMALLPIIGYPVLAFSNATYKGPAGPEGGQSIGSVSSEQPPSNPPIV